VSCASASVFFATSWNDRNRENTIVRFELSDNSGNGLTMLRQNPGQNDGPIHSVMSSGLSGSVQSDVSRRRRFTKSVSNKHHFAGPKITHIFGNWNSARKNGLAQQ